MHTVDTSAAQIDMYLIHVKWNSDHIVDYFGTAVAPVVCGVFLIMYSVPAISTICSVLIRLQLMISLNICL
jgi:hypothetical protein